MSEQETPAGETQTAPGAGAMLRMAREARGTTIPQVAAALKLSPRQIEAIEAEDFSRLSGATFIRGFIRNYARLLKIDAAPLLAALEAQTALPQAELKEPDDAGVRMPASRHDKGLLGAIILALSMLGIALVLYFDIIDAGALLRHAASPAASSQTVQPLPQPAAVVLPSAAVEGETAAAKHDESSAKPAHKSGAHRLIFSFDENAWVEVKDATGRAVFSQMNAKGTTQVVAGHPPFQLVVGNAAHVRLHYNDQPVDLRPHTRVKVARLTLE